VLYIFGLSLPILREWRVTLKHASNTLTLVRAGRCIGSSLNGNYKFHDLATRTIEDVCVSGRAVPSGTYKPLSGTFAGTFSCANPPHKNSGTCWRTASNKSPANVRSSQAHTVTRS
jgi:hypothetical protein